VRGILHGASRFVRRRARPGERPLQGLWFIPSMEQRSASETFTVRLNSDTSSLMIHVPYETHAEPWMPDPPAGHVARPQSSGKRDLASASYSVHEWRHAEASSGGCGIGRPGWGVQSSWREPSTVGQGCCLGNVFVQKAALFGPEAPPKRLVWERSRALGRLIDGHDGGEREAGRWTLVLGWAARCLYRPSVLLERSP
jgi:hypothetical protein